MPPTLQDTEASQGNIMAALFQFPREHCFQVVGSGGESFVTDAIEIVEQTCQETIVREKLKVRLKTLLVCRLRTIETIIACWPHKRQVSAIFLYR